MAVDLKDVKTVDDAVRVMQEIESQDGYVAPAAFGVGIATCQHGELLDVRFPVVNLEENTGTAALIADALGHMSGTATYEIQGHHMASVLRILAPFKGDGEPHPNMEVLERFQKVVLRDAMFDREYKFVAVFINDLEDKPVDAADVYFRLHLLSHLKVQPHGVNLDGAFGKLNMVAWTDNDGPFLASKVDETRLRYGNRINVRSVDKFPRLTDYVIPKDVRIANADQVRLGAYLAPGTVVMHSATVNFNSGSLGTSMIEGSLAHGVVVGARSDVGVGAETIGTLSGGNSAVISIGEDCLLEANCVLGIPIGNAVRLEMGLALKGPTPVKVVESVAWEGDVATLAGSTVKAEELAGINDAIFRRNARTGEVEVIPRGNTIWGELNPVLHDN